MEITILELKKRLKELQENKEKLYLKIGTADVIRYTNKEDRELALNLKPDFTMVDVLQNIENLNKIESKLKSALNEANRITETSLGISIADALIKLAQTQRFAREIVSSIPRSRAKLEVNYQGQYTEYLYDFDTVDCTLSGLEREITSLQLAIDVANASTVVHIED